MKTALIIIGILVVVFLAFIIIGISMSGDKSCQIEIQNGQNKELIIKTYNINRSDSMVMIDSLHLKFNEKLDIGFCVNCSPIHDWEIKYDAIGIYDNELNFHFFKRDELIKYLDKKVQIGCATFVIN